MSGPYPSNWVTLREDVVERDGRSCQNCGADSPGQEFHVHHIVPLSAGGSNARSNLVTLCAGCHYDVHGERRRHGSENDLNDDEVQVVVDLPAVPEDRGGLPVVPADERETQPAATENESEPVTDTELLNRVLDLWIESTEESDEPAPPFFIRWYQYFRSGEE